MSFGFELAAGIATITLDREKRLNALTFEIYQELAELFEGLDRRDDVRAVVITGKGRGAPVPSATWAMGSNSLACSSGPIRLPRPAAGMTPR